MPLPLGFLRCPRAFGLIHSCARFLKHKLSYRAVAKLRRYQFSIKKPCYYCGATTSISKEHVPPKALFHGIDCDRITVPACEEHNSEKSSFDKAILCAMAQVTLEGHALDPHDPIYTKRVLTTAIELQKTFEEVKRLASIQGYFENPLAWQINDMVRFEFGYILIWIRQLTAGLIWHITGESLKDVDFYSGDAFCLGYSVGGPFTQEENLRSTSEKIRKTAHYESLSWHRGWTPYPKPYPRDLYRFDVSFDAFEFEGAFPNVIFGHTFFNGDVTWYVSFECPEPMISVIKKAVL